MVNAGGILSDYKPRGTLKILLSLRDKNVSCDTDILAKIFWHKNTRKCLYFYCVCGCNWVTHLLGALAPYHSQKTCSYFK